MHTQKVMMTSAEIIQPESVEAISMMGQPSMPSHADVALGSPEHIHIASIQALIRQKQTDDYNSEG